MKTQKRIFNFRKQSRIDLPKVNSLFFSEDNIVGQIVDENVRSLQNSSIVVFKEDLNYSVDSCAIPSGVKKQSTFVVDWQIID